MFWEASAARLKYTSKSLLLLIMYGIDIALISKVLLSHGRLLRLPKKAMAVEKDA